MKYIVDDDERDGLYSIQCHCGCGQEVRMQYEYDQDEWSLWIEGSYIKDMMKQSFFKRVWTAIKYILNKQEKALWVDILLTRDQAKALRAGLEKTLLNTPYDERPEDRKTWVDVIKSDLQKLNNN